MPKNDLLYDPGKVYSQELSFMPSILCRWTSFLRISPDFFIGGIQKGGTTSFYYALVQHPQIIPAKNKELFYYSITPHYKKGNNYYRQFFATNFYKKLRESRISKRTLSLDATTNTFDSKEAASRILKDNPKAKIVFVLRNPTERAFSHYKMAVKNNWDFADFEKALELEEKRIEEGAKLSHPEHNYAYQRLGYRSRGIYVEQMKHWFKVFPKENILILSSEEFFADPRKEFNKLTDFLEIDRCDKIEFEKLNVGTEKKMEAETKKKLDEFYKPYNEELFSFLGRRFNW
jgi:hypothetical protein